MDSVPQQSQQTGQQSAQQSSNAQLLSPIVNSIDVSQQNQNSTNDSSNNCSVSVSINGTIVSSNVSEAQNTMSSATNSSVTSMPSASVSTATSIQGSIQTGNTQSPQLLVSSSQPQMVPTSQSTHLNTANGIMTQISGATITSMANQSMAITNQMNAQTAQHNQMQPLLQQTAGNQMSVTMASLPQVQVIQQPMGGTTGTYQLQQVYPQIMMPGMTIQNMPFGGNQGLSLQIPFSGTGGLTTGTMPITSIAAKPPIMSKGVAISPLTQQQHHMISSLRPGMSHQNAQLLKPMLPTQQFVPHSNNQIVFSQILPQQNQHSVHQSILPANANKALLESAKGKQFVSKSENK